MYPRRVYMAVEGMEWNRKKGFCVFKKKVFLEVKPKKSERVRWRGSEYAKRDKWFLKHHKKRAERRQKQIP